VTVLWRLEDWRLEDYDFAIIGILLVILLLTFLWRHFFRWDTRYGLKQRGTDMGTHRTFDPPFPVKSGATIVVIEQTQLDPRRRGTWIVQGMLGAGFRVLLVRSASEISTILKENRCTAVIHHDSFTRKGGMDGVEARINVERAEGIPRAMFVNEGGSAGLKTIIDGLTRAFKGTRAPPLKCSLISCSVSPLADAELALFHDTLVVRRSKASLRDVELQAVGSMLKWMGK
jgi:hypothetical protein